LSQRIVVLGCAGSGKTRFSYELAARLNVPAICLDAIWNPGADALSRFRAKMVELHAGDAWVSDGNFADATFDVRLPRATRIIWLERPRLLCAWRAIVRVFRSGELHKISDIGEVLTFIWRFDGNNRPKIEHNRRLYGSRVPIIRLCNDAEIEAFLRSAAGDSWLAALH
jgi:adenylate kinase family enzyme